MAITKKSELVAAAVKWLARTDITDDVPDCITLAEAYFNRRLRTRQQERVVDLTPTDGSVTLPNDYLAWRRLTWSGNPERDLEYIVPSMFTRFYPDNRAGPPDKFTIEGGFLNFRPIDGAPLTFNYFSKIPPLVGDNDSNWLLDEYPDAYLAGTLAWVNTLVQNNEEFNKWLAACEQILISSNLLSEKTKAPSAIQTTGPTP